MSVLVPTEAQLAAFQALGSGRFGKRTAELLTGEEAIAGLLLRLSQQQDALYQAITGRQSPDVAPGEVMTPQLAAPVDPEVINRLLVFARYLGVVTVGILSVSVSVPTGATPTVLQVPAPAGTANLFLAPLIAVSDYISPNIVIDVNVDGQDLTPVPSELHMVTSPIEIPLGQFYYFEDYIRLTITNTSGTNATLTGIMNLAAIQQNFFFEQFYVPLIKDNVDLMSRRAKQVGAS